MALTKNSKSRLIKKFQTHEKDTGSPEVQVAVLTKKINQLTAHLKKNRKDFSSRRGLLKMVAKRRRLLSFLKREDEKRYKKLLKSTGLKEVA